MSGGIHAAKQLPSARPVPIPGDKTISMKQAVEAPNSHDRSHLEISATITPANVNQTWPLSEMSYEVYCKLSKATKRLPRICKLAHWPKSPPLLEGIPAEPSGVSVPGARHVALGNKYQEI